MNYYQIFRPFYQKAAEQMCLDCRDFIEPRSKILDLGCGSGIIGKKFQNYFKAGLIGIDIKDQRIEKIDFKSFDGKNIPFSENSFDIVLINYVLHHVPSPTQLLKEAKRVSKKVIVFEDLPKGILSKFFCRLHGISFDIIWKNPSQTAFKNKNAWKNIFSEAGLNLVFEKEVKKFPVKKELFVLESAGA